LVSDLIEPGTVAKPAAVKAAEIDEPKGSLLLLVVLALIAGALAYWGAGALWDAAR
jgi:hypothetical protein